MCWLNSLRHTSLAPSQSPMAFRRFWSVCCGQRVLTSHFPLWTEEASLENQLEHSLDVFLRESEGLRAGASEKPVPQTDTPIRGQAMGHSGFEIRREFNTQWVAGYCFVPSSLYNRLIQQKFGLRGLCGRTCRKQQTFLQHLVQKKLEPCTSERVFIR